eukprot:1461641-Amphidinium_carterae.1
MTTRTKLILLLTTVFVIMTTYRSCFGLQVDTCSCTSLSYTCYNMEDENFILEPTAETINNIARVEGDAEYDILELQKMQDMQDDMDDIAETNMRAQEANEPPEDQHWRLSRQTLSEGIDEQI